MTTSKVLDKVRKLLAIAQSASVEEAATAASLAQALMERHRIEDPTVVEQERPVTADWDATLHDAPSLAALPLWQIRLAEAIADVNGCRVFLSDGDGAGICLVGTAEDREACRVLYGWLRSEVERLMRAVRKRSRTARECFGEGAADAVAEQLKQAVAITRHEAIAAASSTALVRVEQALATLDQRAEAASAVYQELCPEEEPRESVFDWHAYLNGRLAGKTVETQGFRQRLN